ncbi:hypothetical protein HYY69_05530 [Candidatus Woesearchaeota archaeon]|nr:hypothetical protein [Candidatus Woesearchaeota archaeon]
MKVQKTVKKIAALGLGASMMGATLIGAMAAADLSSFPTMFVNAEGQFNGLIVYGAGAKAEDVLASNNIQSAIQGVAVKKTAIQPDTSGEKKVKVEQGAELGNNNLYYNQSLNEVEVGIDDSDLPALLYEGHYTDSEGEIENEEGYTQEINFPSASTGRLIFDQDDQDAPEAGSYLWIDDASGVYFFNYQVEFDTSVEYSNESASKLAEDLEGTELSLLGKTFTLTDVRSKKSSATVSTNSLIIDEVQLMAGDNNQWLSQGETVTVTIDGTEHVIELLDVTEDAAESAGSCGFSVDGTVMWVDVDETRTTNGVRIGVVDAKALHSQAQDTDVCQTVIGATKITLKDADEVEFNDEELDGTVTDIDIASTTTSGKWSGFKVSWAPENDEIYLAPGDEFVDPIFGGWKLVFGGLVSSGREEVSFVGGSSSGEIVFTNEDGQEVTLPLSADADCSELSTELGVTTVVFNFTGRTFSSCSGSNAEEFVFWGTDAPVSGDQNQDEKVYLQSEFCQGNLTTSTGDVTDCQDAYFLVVTSAREAHLLQIGTIDRGDTEIDLKDVTYGTQDNDEDYTENATSTINLGGGIGDIQLNISQIGIYFTSIGSSNGASIETLQEAFIIINNSNLNSTRFEGLGFNEYNDGKFSGGDTPAALYLAASELAVNASYDDTDDDVIEFVFNRKLTGAGKSGQTSNNGITAAGFGFHDVSSTNDDFSKFLSFKGTLITYDDEDKKSVLIDHPHDTVHAEMFVAPVAVESTEDVGLYTTDIQLISVDQVKLDKEVTSVTDKNMVSIGGPCANSVTAALMSNPESCETALGVEVGQALVKLYENGEFVSMVVAGQTAQDTRDAGEVLYNWKNNKNLLKGMEVVLNFVEDVVVETAEPLDAAPSVPAATE